MAGTELYGGYRTIWWVQREPQRKIEKMHQELELMLQDVLDSGYTIDQFVVLLSDHDNAITKLVFQILESCVGGDKHKQYQALEAAIVNLENKRSSREQVSQWLNRFNWTIHRLDCGDPRITLRALFGVDVYTATVDQLYEAAVLGMYKGDDGNNKRLTGKQLLELFSYISPPGYRELSNHTARNRWFKEYEAKFCERKGDSHWDTTEKLNKVVLPTSAFYGDDHMQKLCSFEEDIF